MWLGIPCTTFSLARKDDGIGPSDERPMGLEGLFTTSNGGSLQGFSLVVWTLARDLSNAAVSLASHIYH